MWHLIVLLLAVRYTSQAPQNLFHSTSQLQIQNVNDYVLLYPTFSSNGLQFPSPQTNNIQNLYGIAPTEHSENPSTDDDDTDETNDGGSDELSEESDENGNGDGDGTEDGDGDEDEDVGEETGTDFWQSLIEYFGICEGSNKVFRIAILSRNKVNRLPLQTN